MGRQDGGIFIAMTDLGKEYSETRTHNCGKSRTRLIVGGGHRRIDDLSCGKWLYRERDQNAKSDRARTRICRSHDGDNSKPTCMYKELDLPERKKKRVMTRERLASMDVNIRTWDL